MARVVEARVVAARLREHARAFLGEALVVARRVRGRCACSRRARAARSRSGGGARGGSTCPSPRGSRATRRRVRPRRAPRGGRARRCRPRRRPTPASRRRRRRWRRRRSASRGSGASRVDHRRVARDDGGPRVGVEERHLRRQLLGVPEVVVVEERDRARRAPRGRRRCGSRSSPRFSWTIRRTRGSAAIARRTTAAVSSREPSSTTRTSRSPNVWSSDALERRLQEGRGVVRRDEHADARCAGSRRSRSSVSPSFAPPFAPRTRIDTRRPGGAPRARGAARPLVPC